ncbi:MAG: glycosyltransferase family 4 protein [Firmicutes bacterium]|nr:glycosyltransferase family 4 protein [Bacillota bacterium]
MKKLLIVTTVSSTLQAFILPFARHFRGKGWQVDAMASGAPTCLECVGSFDRAWDAKWSRNPAAPSNLSGILQVKKEIRTLIEREDYDLVHVHTPVASFVTRYALRKLRSKGGPKVIYTAHGFHFYPGGPLLKNSLFISLEKLAGRWTDYLIVINREDEEAARKNRIVPAERLYYMPGIGVDTDYFNPKKVSAADVEQVRKELGLRKDQPLFLMIAEFIPRKRHQDLLLAFSRLNNPDAHLALAGTGELVDDMKALAQRLDVAGRVHFLGSRRDIPALIRASAATLLTSQQEGLPRSVMESLSLEVPVIGSNIRGTRELLSDGCGLLVQLGDIDGYAEAMAQVLKSPQEARAMAKRGRAKMIGKFDIKLIIKAHEELYAKAMGVENALT